MRAGTSVAIALLLAPHALEAQGFLDRFSYEGLRFRGIGVEVGAVASNRLTGEATGAVRIDYGMIAPKIRVLVGLSYFKGDFDRDEVSEFEGRLRGVVVDPTGDFTIEVGTITWSDLEAALDLQYMFANVTRVTPYAGIGFAAHIRNGSGSAIAGTFVEDALDTIDAGINVSAGLAIAVAAKVDVTADLRAGLASELSTASARFGLMYRIGR